MTANFKTLHATFLVCLLLVSAGTLASERGREVYADWCLPCHADSPFAPGTIQLRATRGEALAIVEKRDDLTAPAIRSLVREGLAGMPKFRRTEISESDLDALIAYLIKK